MSVNKVILVGRLGADPESRSTPNGVQVCNLRLATNHVAYDRDGNKNESTEWHRVVMFGRQAEVCEQYLRKGSQVYIEGRIQTRKYTDRDGIERYATEIIGEKMQMLPSGKDDDKTRSDWGKSDGFESQGKAPGNDYAAAKGGARPQQQSQQQPTKTAESLSELDDDLPF